MHSHTAAAVQCLAQGDAHGAWVKMGAVLLAVTGCEALYADMGHFSKASIRASAGAAAARTVPYARQPCLCGSAPARQPRAARSGLPVYSWHLACIPAIFSVLLCA